MNSNMMHMLPTVHIIKRNSVSTNGSTVFEEQSRHVLRNNARRCLRRTTINNGTYYVRRELDSHAPDAQIKS